jgi:hypothetical protein
VKRAVPFLVHPVLMVIQVNLVFQERKVNVVYVVFLVYLAIQVLVLVYLVHKDVCPSLYNYIFSNI